MYKVPIEGQHVVIIGRGLTIGRPLANLLSLKEPNANATVTVCHTGTAFLPEYTKEADIIVAAAGRPSILTARHGAARRGGRRARARRWRAAGSCPTSTRRAPRSRAGSRPGSAASAPRRVRCCCARPSRRPSAERHERAPDDRGAAGGTAVRRLRHAGRAATRRGARRADSSRPAAHGRPGARPAADCGCSARRCSPSTSSCC